ncbi:unnamed protein product [Bursaphelenchus xylophilus]|uniref:(pine wood nematode) hypothetical protein n=1 Tax=Bursaphelenchus xylophilus TaxID=6326 RepID=A0A1I7RHS4_BURXY|nr:unnamed protein product [Bursaphelenchus xylophilus]CAG9115443.1 unnamed protein product [Bursaphelenchus xylophilus]
MKSKARTPQRSISNDDISQNSAQVHSPIGSAADSAICSAAASSSGDLTISDSIADLSINSRKKSKKSAMRSVMSGLMDLVSTRKKSSVSRETTTQRRKTSEPVISVSNYGIKPTNKQQSTLTLEKLTVSSRGSCPLSAEHPRREQDTLNIEGKS